MKQNELDHGKDYAIELPGTVAKATYLGRVGEGVYAKLKFFVPSLNIIHHMGTAHHVINSWEEYTKEEEADFVRQGFKHGLYDLKSGEINSLILFFRTLGIDAGLMSIITVENDEPEVEPALYIKHRDIKRMSTLLKEMHLHAFETATGESSDDQG